jgi:hypothetical protein
VSVKWASDYHKFIDAKPRGYQSTTNMDRNSNHLYPPKIRKIRSRSRTPPHYSTKRKNEYEANGSQKYHFKYRQNRSRSDSNQKRLKPSPLHENADNFDKQIHSTQIKSPTPDRIKKYSKDNLDQTWSSTASSRSASLDRTEKENILPQEESFRLVVGNLNVKDVSSKQVPAPALE